MGGTMIHELTWAAVQHTLVVGAGPLLLALCYVAAGYVRSCSGQHAGAGQGATTVRQIQNSLAAEAESRFAQEYIGRHRLREQLHGRERQRSP
ncbi:hypothetical protein SAMN05216215_101697 [Saccharopolyspora shandongensis]|uniref:Uncharacterized protein n=1 Tax=Saccharopolyspora shandongensis TaxID=418495 RepID=A0A1H3F6V1_9PSEU|nr:hypothetical protein [Saccharopolyspora shandongensis]SDX86660.1 hypothetical protein SAMN05216215_101697 [Saccharopolyspora shandongensis]